MSCLSLRFGIFHHIADWLSHFCRNPICLSWLGQTVELPISKSTQPRSDGTPCKLPFFSVSNVKVIVVFDWHLKAAAASSVYGFVPCAKMICLKSQSLTMSSTHASRAFRVISDYNINLKIILCDFVIFLAFKMINLWPFYLWECSFCGLFTCGEATQVNGS